MGERTKRFSTSATASACFGTGTRRATNIAFSLYSHRLDVYLNDEFAHLVGTVPSSSMRRRVPPLSRRRNPRSARPPRPCRHVQATAWIEDRFVRSRAIRRAAAGFRLAGALEEQGRVFLSVRSCVTSSPRSSSTTFFSRPRRSPERTRQPGAAHWAACSVRASEDPQLDARAGLATVLLASAP
jgi:hypothetical protein